MVYPMLHTGETNK